MYIKSLNPVQKEAATFGDGPLLILAGAGSGKTRVLTARIAWLVEKKGVEPSNILAVTFTNKAAGEMRERLSAILGPSARELWLGTFHSLGLRILRREAGRLGFTGELIVYGDDDQLTLIKECMKELDINEKTFPAKKVLWRINQAKNDNIGPGEFHNQAHDFLAERTARVYELYQKRLRGMNCLDFGDLICGPLNLFAREPEVLEKYRRNFGHILVDEYQDTNKAQYSLTRMIAEGTRNILAVGDPDQSIYAWRGADITNILDFERDYPDATVMRLEQNYRSTKNILTAANFVIKNNSQRMEKDLWTDRGEGDPITYEEVRDEREEARKVVRKARALTSESDMTFGDMAVFYRTNAQSRVFEEELIREGLPYTVVGGVRFYDRMEIKDALAHIRLAANPDDAMSMRRVINKPSRKIGPATLDKIKNLASSEGLNLFEAVREACNRGVLNKKAEKFVEAFDSFRDGLGKDDLGELTLRLLEDTGYMMMWQEEGSEEAFDRVENLFELVSAIKDFTAAGEDVTLADFLDHVSLISDLDSYEDRPDRLTLMTIHSAKGLEFRAVFLTGLEEGLFPHSRSMDDPEQLEEERRLCYVAMTRAMERLYIYSTATRYIYGETRYQTSSRFVTEIPPEHLERVGERTGGSGIFGEGGGVFDDPGGVYTDPGDVPPVAPGETYYTTDDSQLDPTEFNPATALRVGMKVRHPSFGLGVIRDRSGVGEDTKVTVAFKGAGVKKLALRYAVLEPVM